MLRDPQQVYDTTYQKSLDRRWVYRYTHRHNLPNNNGWTGDKIYDGIRNLHLPRSQVRKRGKISLNQSLIYMNPFLPHSPRCLFYAPQLSSQKQSILNHKKVLVKHLTLYPPTYANGSFLHKLSKHAIGTISFTFITCSHVMRFVIRTRHCGDHQKTLLVKGRAEFSLFSVTEVY
jgi:hypothetical protein